MKDKKLTIKYNEDENEYEEEYETKIIDLTDYSLFYKDDDEGDQKQLRDDLEKYFWENNLDLDYFNDDRYEELESYCNVEKKYDENNEMISESWSGFKDDVTIQEIEQLILEARGYYSFLTYATEFRGDILEQYIECHWYDTHKYNEYLKDKKEFSNFELKIPTNSNDNENSPKLMH